MKNLKRIRNYMNYTQKELSQKSGVSQPYINELEKGRKSDPSIIILSKLANALEVSISDVIDDEVNKGHAGYLKEYDLLSYDKVCSAVSL